MRSRAPASIDSLSARQRDIVRLLAEGRSNKEIANQLDLTEGTVKQHLIRIFAKLGVSNRTWAASLWHAAQASEDPGLPAANDVLPHQDSFARHRRVSVVTLAVAAEGAAAMRVHRTQCETLARNYGGGLLPSPPGLTVAVFASSDDEANDTDCAVRFAFGMLPLNSDEALDMRIGLATASHASHPDDQHRTLAQVVQTSMRLALGAAPGTVAGCPDAQLRLGDAAAVLHLFGGGPWGQGVAAHQSPAPVVALDQWRAALADRRPPGADARPQLQGARRAAPGPAVSTTPETYSG